VHVLCWGGFAVHAYSSPAASHALACFEVVFGFAKSILKHTKPKTC